MKAVIMAGGKGTRLGSSTSNTPKPMIEINNKPILQYQIENLKRYGIKDIILIVGYLADKIKNYFSDGKKLEVNIQYITEKTPLGTAGGLYHLKGILDDDFLLIYGDIFFDIDIQRFIDFHKNSNGIGTLFLHPNSHPYDSDIVILDNECKVVSIDLKNNKRKYYYKNCVNAGLYVFSHKILSYIEQPVKKDLEKDIIRNMIYNHETLYGYISSEYIRDIGTCERLEEVKLHFNKGIVQTKNLSNKQKCIFLDRDGTINKYKGLLYDVEKLELEEGAVEGIRKVNDSEFLCIVITNQPVVARNLCTIQSLEEIHRKLETLLGNGGAYVNDILYCPHHPDSGYKEENKLYKVICNCRKPKTGLVDRCVDKYNIDLGSSYFIGDTTVDIMTGKNSGLKTILLQTGEGGRDNKFDIKPDFVCGNLKEAIDIILGGQ